MIAYNQKCSINIHKCNGDCFVRNVEDITFGSSGLDRSAAVRGTVKANASKGDSVLFVWRGKILMNLENQPSLAKFEFPHPLCKDADQIFLGTDNSQNYIAFDISQWEPAVQDQPDPNLFFDPTEQRHPRLDKKYAFCELRGQMLNLSKREAELCAIAKGLFHWNTLQNYCSNCGSLLKKALSGWQKNCDNCGASHFPRTDPVVIMLITKGDKVLLGRSLNWPQKMYSLLAGFVEPGETIEGAVRREVMEESGIQVGKVSYLASQPWVFPNSLMLGCHGEAQTEEIIIDRNEIEDARWVGKSELLDIFAGLDKSIFPARKGSIANFLLEKWLSDRLYY